jgi:hypothetical protein
LGSNVTIQGGEVKLPISQNYANVFAVSNNATLVLEPGSKITGHDSSKLSSAGGAVIRIDARSTVDDSLAEHGKIRIEGGEISNCKVWGGVDGSLIQFIYQEFRYGAGSLYLAPGNILTLSGNTDKDGRPSNEARFYLQDVENIYDLSQYLESGLSKPDE